MATLTTKGNCYLCGVELGKTAMKNHILKCHGGETGQECRLLKIEGANDKDYWLYVDIPVDKTLNALDDFLRRIWLECCGHMSEFQDLPKSTKIRKLQAGDRFLHLYDFGSTTETLITVIGTTWRPPQKKIVRLLSRNVPPQFSCGKCGAPAEYVEAEGFWSYENPFYCKKCANKYDDEGMLLPVTNSPRMGVCGYSGELDTFAFVQPECAPVSASQAPVKKEPKKEPKKEQKKEPRKRSKNDVVGLYPDELYELAFAFRSAKPWENMFEDEMFAIPLPNGETGYCSVMGADGEHFSLAVYPGEQGLQSFQHLQESADSDDWFMLPNQMKEQEELLSQLCVQCSLENKDLLQPEELSSVRDYAARHNIKFRGSNSFPKFFKFRPAFLPEYVTSEEDIRILCEALRAVLAVNEKLMSIDYDESEKRQLGFSYGLAAARSLPVLTREQDDFVWTTEMLPDVLPYVYPRPVLQDEILLARLKKEKKRNTTWICDVVMCPQHVQGENGSTPFFPYMLFTVDKKKGTVLIPTLVNDYEQNSEAVLHNLGEQMLEEGVPRRIIVTNDKTHALLEALTASLGIKLEQTDGEAMLDGLEEEYAELAMNANTGDVDEEDAVAFATEILMGTDDASLLKLPNDIWDFVRFMLNEGHPSPEVMTRFYNLDDKRRR